MTTVFNLNNIKFNYNNINSSGSAAPFWEQIVLFSDLQKNQESYGKTETRYWGLAKGELDEAKRNHFRLFLLRLSLGSNSEFF